MGTCSAYLKHIEDSLVEFTFFKSRESLERACTPPLQTQRGDYCPHRRSSKQTYGRPLFPHCSWGPAIKVEKGTPWRWRVAKEWPLIPAGTFSRLYLWQGINWLNFRKQLAMYLKGIKYARALWLRNFPLTQEWMRNSFAHSMMLLCLMHKVGWTRQTLSLPLYC